MRSNGQWDFPLSFPGLAITQIESVLIIKDI